MRADSPLPEDFFGEAVAERYDADESQISSPEVVGATIDLLAELAGSGSALEFGIGTGRIALPLSERGVPVHGIDLSTAMVTRLRVKAGSEAIGVTIGDFSTTQVDGTFALVYLVFNTIMNLTTQDAQVECFRNAAAHLDSGGHFVIEVSVPDLQRLPPGERYRPFDVSADHLGFDEYDVLTQGLISHHLSRNGNAFGRNSVPFRYVWPSELDLMARLAGLTPENRWEDWTRAPFTALSGQHVSVWRKP